MNFEIIELRGRDTKKNKEESLIGIKGTYERKQ